MREELARQLREARLDHSAFDTPLRACDLAHCKAACCHDGVVLQPEEVDRIAEILGDLLQLGFSGDTWLREHQGCLKTATRSAASHELAKDFPVHFKRTRCVFLDPEHRCLLQRLSIAQGRHEWIHKPLGCWMHPVALLPGSVGGERPVLTLRTHENSSGPMTDFAACTHCGREDPSGEPAWRVLTKELAMLSEISGRDFVAELSAPSVDWACPESDEDQRSTE